MNKLPIYFLLILLMACTPPVDETPRAAAPAPSAVPTNTLVPAIAPTEAAIADTLPAETTAPTESSFGLPQFTPFPSADLGALVMDGFFDDWRAFSPIYVDPSGDGGSAGIDFNEIYAAHTDSHLLLQLSLGKTVNLQSEPALHVVIGFGEDVISYDFGNRKGRFNGDFASQADLGLVSLPTVTSDIFEIAIPYPSGSTDPVLILFSDPNSGGDLATPDGQALAYAWTNYVSPAEPRSLDRPAGALRVVSWNVLRDNIFDNNLEPHFARVLQALQPDVILIQEIYIYSEKTALNHISEWLGSEWHAQQQGDLITVSRFPFIENWRDSNHNLRARIFPTLLDVDGQPFLVFNAHLSCCDRDQDRQDEVDSFIGFLREVDLPEGTPFLLAGDLNLVGDAQQLITLLTGNIIDEEKFGPDFAPDWGGDALADLLPGHTHSIFKTTWRDDQTSFAPGRLDFIIYSDSVINAQGFVLETAELPAEVLAAYGLQAEDTVEASDHLPLVVDIVLVSAP